MIPLLTEPGTDFFAAVEVMDDYVFATDFLELTTTELAVAVDEFLAGDTAARDRAGSIAELIGTFCGGFVTQAEVDAVVAQSTSIAPPTSGTPAGPTSTMVVATATVPTGSIPTSPPLATFEGSGNEVVDLGFTMTDAYIVDATHTGDRNFIVRPLNEDLSEQSSIINIIGPWIGRHLLNVHDDDLTRYLQVDADGAWTFAIRPLLSAGRWSAGELHGVNNTVVIFDGVPGIVEYAYRGDHNFVVWMYGEDSDLLVNEIGSTDGTTVIGSSPSIVEIQAEGEWSLHLR